MKFGLHFNHIPDLDRHSYKQASKKTGFTVESAVKSVFKLDLTMIW